MARREKTIVLPIRVAPEFKEHLQSLASKHGQALSGYCNGLLQFALKCMGPENVPEINDVELPAVKRDKSITAKEQAKQLIEDAVIQVPNVLIELMQSKRTPAGTRLQAANSLLDRAGLIAPKRQEIKGEGEISQGALLEAVSKQSRTARKQGKKSARTKIPRK